MGRPSAGTNSLEVYSSAAKSGQYRLLFREAAKRGFTPTTLAAAGRIDRRNLDAYVKAERPLAKTVEHLAFSLGYSGMVCRALTGRMAEHDLRLAREILEKRLSQVDLLSSRKDLDLSPEHRRAALSAFILGEAGLTDVQSRPALGLGLSAFDEAVVRAGGKPLPPSDLSRLLQLEEAFMAIEWAKTALTTYDPYGDEEPDGDDGFYDPRDIGGRQREVQDALDKAFEPYRKEFRALWREHYAPPLDVERYPLGLLQTNHECLDEAVAAFREAQLKIHLWKLGVVQKARESSGRK